MTAVDMSAPVIWPDGITPKSAWRVWNVIGTGVITSFNETVWPVGAPLRAECPHRKAFVDETGAPKAVPDFTKSPYQKVAGGFATGGVVFMSTSAFTRPPSLEQQRDHWLDSQRLWMDKHGVKQGTKFDVESGENYMDLLGQRIYVGGALPPPAITVPTEACTCGIYAAVDRKNAESYLGMANVYGPYRFVLGRVALWGRVVIHEGGYRAEYAYPQSFFTDDETLKRQLVPYGVPILPFREGKEEKRADVGLVPVAIAEALVKHRDWYEWPLRIVGLLLSMACAALMARNMADSLWWGATGWEVLRQILGVAGAMMWSLFIWYYVNLARRIWRWRR